MKSTFIFLTLLPLLLASKNCTKPGFLCDSCTTLVACVENDDGTFTKDTIATCKEPEKCVGGRCTTRFDPFCSGLADLPFPCRKVGIFPDPFYCDKFVLCVNGTYGDIEPYLQQCDKGFGFSIARDICDIKLSNGECEEGVYPLPLCKHLGQSGALPGNPAKYYICEEYSETNVALYPVINVCPSGEIFDDYYCVEKTTITTTTP